MKQFTIVNDCKSHPCVERGSDGYNFQDRYCRNSSDFDLVIIVISNNVILPVKII